MLGNAGMRLTIYKAIMRCPQFRGLGRVRECVRRALYPPLVAEAEHDLRLVGPEGSIVAIDPQPYNCEKILARCRLNEFSNILAVVAVAGEREGAVMLRVQSARDTSRLTLAFDPVNDAPYEFRVPMTRPDSLLDTLELAEVKLRKIDVEGYKPNVLAGMGDRIEGLRNIILETLPEMLGSPGTLTILDMLRDWVYALKIVEGGAPTVTGGLPENNLWAANSADLSSGKSTVQV